MTHSNKVITATIAAVVGVGLTMATLPAQAGKHMDKQQKCYGVAKAGMNDCGGKKTGHTCQGLSKKNGDRNDWLYVTKGLCKKLVGGSLIPAYKKKG